MGEQERIQHSTYAIGRMRWLMQVARAGIHSRCYWRRFCVPSGGFGWLGMASGKNKKRVESEWEHTTLSKVAHSGAMKMRLSDLLHLG
jgi:hypothetical protein